MVTHREALASLTQCKKVSTCDLTPMAIAKRALPKKFKVRSFTAGEARSFTKPETKRVPVAQ